MFRVRLDVPTPVPERVRVEGAALRHLRVARVVPGETVEVFDGRGRAWAGWLETVDEGGAVLRLAEERRGEAGRTVVLIQGLPKGDKLDWVLQKSTELGVSAVWPVVTARSVARPKLEALAARHARWQRIVEEAARQSGRTEVPEVAALRPLEEAVKALPTGVRLLVLDEEEQRERLGPAAGDGAVALVIGPEGGLEREEVEALRTAGGVPVSLGPLVLRTETAGVAALAVLRHLDGLLG
ncbi:MAG TPA: 16S rRNA (uracil(1498)-N(3))-methyltransferase [Myxococcaceae bacterium]|nr:16S rRNA (uracil(1498)-N(3))-methyltransferase [Myxococcaceae bacterium]